MPHGREAGTGAAYSLYQRGAFPPVEGGPGKPYFLAATRRNVDIESCNLYDRVRLQDRREGYVNSIFFPGMPHGKEKPPEIVTVMVDDYVQVECWPWQLTKLRRTRGQTVKSKDPEGSFYEVELANNARLRMAIWHDHWDRIPPKGEPITAGYGLYGKYWEEYSGGNKAPLPAHEDIRGQAPAPPQKPQRPRLF